MDPKRILIKGNRGTYEEKEAAAAISPGHLVELTSGDKLQKHSTEGGRAANRFAYEDANQGHTIDDDYSTDDLVFAYHALPGDWIYAFLKAGENVSIGDELISAGDGTLIKNGSEASGTTVQDVVAIAREAKDLSGSGDEDTRIKVEIL